MASAQAPRRSLTRLVVGGNDEVPHVEAVLAAVPHDVARLRRIVGRPRHEQVAPPAAVDAIDDGLDLGVWAHRSVVPGLGGDADEQAAGLDRGRAIGEHQSAVHLAYPAGPAVVVPGFHPQRPAIQRDRAAVTE